MTKIKSLFFILKQFLRESNFEAKVQYNKKNFFVAENLKAE